MIIIDQELQQLQTENKPIRVGILGAGFMARGIALQISRYTPGMKVCALINRSPDKARTMLAEIGVDPKAVTITDDYQDVYQQGVIDVIVEATGTTEYAVNAMVAAFEAGVHVVSMNAEVDATIGHALVKKAKECGVGYTVSDGDQPGVELNLYRYVKGLGLRPVLCGNVKGLHDPYRTPTTQASFAQKWGQTPHMVTSFADGTKISFEQACVANATGMTVARRGMLGPTVPYGTPIEKTIELYSQKELLSGPGIVDYVVGAVPNGGVFVLATLDNDPIQSHYLNYYKMGEGPIYCFFAPMHLCHMETPKSIARLVLHKDQTIAAIGNKQTVEVVSRAKKDLKAGEVLDTFGGYTMHGECEASTVARSQNLLPIGLAVGATLKNDVRLGDYLTFDDVTLPPGRTIDLFWTLQQQT